MMKMMFWAGVRLLILQGIFQAVTSYAQITIPDTDPLPAESVPFAGTFYSALNPTFPPLPANINGWPAWSLGSNIFLLDDLAGTGFSHRNSLDEEGPPGPPGGGEGDTNINTFSYVVDTNGLWLRITNIASGWVYLNLYHPTNSVYEILSKTALSSTNWSIEGELWPTNTSVMPFTVPQAGRSNLFLWARDWTGVTEGTNTVPSWWLWNYYGSIALSDTNLDSQGNTLLYDYQNNLDPNIISFTLSATNLHVNQTTVPLTVNLQAGTPYYYAVLVNDTNYADASWQAYTGANLTASLGTTDGVYNVWVGLKGLPAAATPTWDIYDIRFHLDRSAPVVTITSPFTVIKPYLQLKGFANEQLARINYDVSNAWGILTNHDGFVTDQGFDTNVYDFTTNFFQCYDVPLTTNTNAITLRLTDNAGNVTTTNFNVILDYSTATNPPVVTVIWPQDGMAVSGSNCTLRGTMSDETGSIMAQVINGDGTTNVITGLVERNNMFWLENIPLNGTNQISIVATDAAGNTTTTNLTLNPSTLSLAITSTPTGTDLYNPTGSVSGTVSDPSAMVTVNGVTATNNGDGTWTADNVPVFGKGTVTYDASATPAGTGAATKVSIEAEQPPIIMIVQYNSAEMEDIYDDYYGHMQGYTWVKNYKANYVPDVNGQWRQTYEGTVSSDGHYYGTTGHVDYQWSDADPIGTEVWTSNDGSDGAGPILNEPNVYSVPDANLDNYFGAMVVHFFADNLSYRWNNDDDPGYGATLSMNACTSMKIFTGGKSGVGRRNLFCIHVTGEWYDDPSDPNWTFTKITDIDPPSITLLGKNAGGDGNLWVALPDNESQDLNLTAPFAHYSITADSGKYKFTITANGTDITTNTPTFCVGQKVVFTSVWDVTPSYVDVFAGWTFPAKYVNASVQSFGSDSFGTTVGSVNYFINSALLTNISTTNWYVNKPGGKVSMYENLYFANGQYATVAATGNIDIYRPSFTGFLPILNGFAWDSPALTGNISWRMQIVSKYDGAAGVIQLIDGHSFPLSTDGCVLDGSSVFYGTIGTNGAVTYSTNVLGSQFVGLTDSPTGYAAPCVTLDANFTDYVMFQPAGSGNIFVTISTVGWNMDGHACVIGGIDQSNLPPAGPADESDTFPQWTNTHTD